MEARVTKVARVSARFSKSLAKTPVSPKPGKGAIDHPRRGPQRRLVRLRAVYLALRQTIGEPGLRVGQRPARPRSRIGQRRFDLCYVVQQ